MTMTFDPPRTGLVLVDMQNDFLHGDGAYARGGARSDDAVALIPRLKRVAEVARAAGAWVVSTQFTLVPGRGGEPFVSDHLGKLRPFLGKGDFAPGSFGQDLVAELKPADFSVEKVAYSAFYMSRLEFVLRRAGIETLIFGGIVTNGGVESTVRDAHVRDFHTVVLSDGCTAPSQQAHEAALASMATISPLMTCEEAVAALE